MKKRIFTLVLIAMLFLTCAACAKNEEPEFTNPTPEATTPAPEGTSEPTPEPTPEATPEVPHSLTTGLESDRAYRPMLAVIENSPAARPQIGLQQADIIYEFLAEGSVTRFVCVFNDTLPTEIMPVRSCRIYFLTLQREWDAPIIHYGGSTAGGKEYNVYGSRFDDIKVRLDGLTNADCTKYFKRSSAKKAPHNVYTNVQELAENFYDYTPDERVQFTFDGTVRYETGTDFTYVGLPYNTGNADTVNFTYNAQDGRLYRAHKNTPHETTTVTVDENGSETRETAQYSCVNLVVQYTDVSVYDESGVKRIDLVGSGDCDYFIGGQHITGKWVRESEDDSTKYYLDDGITPVTLRPGNTWISIHPDNAKATVR